jgi:hypothetical protein
VLSSVLKGDHAHVPKMMEPNLKSMFVFSLESGLVPPDPVLEPLGEHVAAVYH